MTDGNDLDGPFALGRVEPWGGPGVLPLRGLSGQQRTTPEGTLNVVGPRPLTAADRVVLLSELHSRCRPAFVALAAQCEAGFEVNGKRIVFAAFEAYRSPARQRQVYAAGTSKAREYQSPHQFGLAVDFVPLIDGKFVWLPADDKAWDALDRAVSGFATSGLSRPISWDRPHVEHSLWAKVRAALRS
jgi:hypothetical protein